jgi:hypothetical protein
VLISTSPPETRIPRGRITLPGTTQIAMKRFILCVSIVVFTQSLMAANPMARFAKVIDSRTIVVERIGGAEVVHLANVDVPPADEQTARDYIREKLAGSYVLIENGNVYRSPDALFINRELAYGAYGSPSLKMRVFGELAPPPLVHPGSRNEPPARDPVQVPRPRRAKRK